MHRTPIDPVVPSAQEWALRQALAALAAGQKFTKDDLPPIVTRLLMEILKETEIGNAVALVPVEAEITTQQAADLLNVSRPFLVGLIENGTLAGRMVGKHRRLSLQEVLAYRAERFAKRERRSTRWPPSIRNSALYERNALCYGVSRRECSLSGASSRHPPASCVAGAVSGAVVQPVHDEWMAALRRDRPDIASASLERTRHLMDAHFQDAPSKATSILWTRSHCRTLMTGTFWRRRFMAARAHRHHQSARFSGCGACRF